MSSALANNDAALLAELESIVEEGVGGFLRVGNALSAIRDRKLYRLTHETFEAYCAERWHFSASRARQLVGGVRVFDAVVGGGVTKVTPTSERQVRELARLETAEQQQEAWEKSVERAGGVEPSAKVVRAVVRELRGLPPSEQGRRTPPWLFDFLNAEFGPFDVDVCAEPHNALCRKFFTEQDDAMTKAWGRKNFCNPPFLLTKRIVPKAVEQAQDGKFTLILAPVGGSQAWHHDHARRYTELSPNCRVNFDTPDGLPTGDGSDEGDGADRDTSVLLIGPGFENRRFGAGEFKVRVLDLKAVRP